MGRSKSPHETRAKKRKLSSNELAPPTPEICVLQGSHSAESGSANWTPSIRALSPRIDEDDQSSDVINGATSERKGIMSTAYDAFESIISQIPRMAEDADLVASTAKSKVFRDGIVNDKCYNLERTIQGVVSLPRDSGSRNIMSQLLVKPLWNDLHHPPLSYVGREHKYRQADGSNNNIMYPRLGAAGSSYARTVTPRTLAPPVAPDAGLIFDTIFARGEHIREHPCEISSLLFYMASIITHDIFRTDESDASKLKNSSYLDLSPLYGSSDDPSSDTCVAKVRAFHGGMLKPDSFSESRVFALPPGVAVMLICFNRFHNYVAAQLKEINDGNRFGPSPEKSQQKTEAQIDEDLFQTARLVTCGLYVNIILHDYVRTILNLQTTDNSWTLDPRSDAENVFDKHGVSSGIGNQVSVEFNLVYRWHSAISERDAQWVEDMYADILGEDGIYQHLQDPKEIPTRLHAHFAKIRAQNPEDRQLRGVARNQSGKYEDQDLANILTKSTEDVAGAFGSKNVPLVMKAVEVMGIEQARTWGVCTLNEFRKFFRLAPYRTFADITKDVEVATTLETLYSKPDYVELYPGLIAEDVKDAFEPGSGLCPGFTTSRTILADAVALVRGDRFCTLDYSPVNLTNWGWNLIKSDPDAAAGGVIYNLFMRALPLCYKGNSVYAMFPFVHPGRTKRTLSKLGKEADYDFSTPQFQPSPASVKSYKAVSDILKNPQDFKVPWGPHTSDLTGHEYMLSGDTLNHRMQHQKMERDLYSPSHYKMEIREYYYQITHQLIESQSRALGRNRYQLDVVRDIGNLSHTLFVARMFHIPIQESDDFSVGASTRDLYDGLAIVFAYVFRDGDPAKFFKLRWSAKQASKRLNKLIRLGVKDVVRGKYFHFMRLFGGDSSEKLLSSYGKHMVERLTEDGKTIEEIVAEILPTAAAATATQAQAMAQMLDFYLRPEHLHHWPGIRRCAYSKSREGFDTLKKYALEACRLAPAASAVLRVTSREGEIVDNGKSIEYKPGDVLHLDFVSAGRDRMKFSSNADEVDVHRDVNSYLHHGMGPHACLGRPITQISLAVQLGLFAKLKNLQRLPGQRGRLKYTTNLPGGLAGSARLYMTEDESNWSPFPCAMKIQHEGICQTLEEHETLPL